jgi:hypothetical protein
MRASLGAVLTLVALCSGCVSVPREPELAMPARPPISVYQGPEGFYCMDQDDFQAFVRWLRKLNEFEAARTRYFNGR